jgi:DNA polymerase-3 subunit epsilon
MRFGADGGGCFPTGRHYPGIAHLLRAIAAGLANEHAAEHPLADLPLVAIDTETTGKDPSVDRIVEIACVVWQNGSVIRSQYWLVNPGVPIPREAFEVHGIGDDDVRDKPTFAQIVDQLFEALAGAVPVAYNAEFDRAFLTAELMRASAVRESAPPACRKGIEWIDPLIWARELHKLEKGKSLGDVCARLGIDIVRAHRATDDAEATLRVLAAFAADPRVPKTYAGFVQEQRRLSRLHDEERREAKQNAAATAAARPA